MGIICNRACEGKTEEIIEGAGGAGGVVDSDDKVQGSENDSSVIGKQAPGGVGGSGADDAEEEGGFRWRQSGLGDVHAVEEHGEGLAQALARHLAAQGPQLAEGIEIGRLAVGGLGRRERGVVRERDGLGARIEDLEDALPIRLTERCAAHRPEPVGERERLPKRLVIEDRLDGPQRRLGRHRLVRLRADQIDEGLDVGGRDGDVAGEGDTEENEEGVLEAVGFHDGDQGDDPVVGTEQGVPVELRIRVAHHLNEPLGVLQ